MKKKSFTNSRSMQLSEKLNMRYFKHHIPFYTLVVYLKKIYNEYAKNLKINTVTKAPFFRERPDEQEDVKCSECYRKFICNEQLQNHIQKYHKVIKNI